MIGSLRGAVLERTEDSCALLEVSGVGYFVSVTPRTLAELEPGASAFLYVHHHIREEAQTLFGFLHRDERTTFQVLIATHGIGPALALAILGTHAPAALVDIVAVKEAEQRLRIFTNVVVHVQERRSARLELGECARCDRHEVADATDL